MANEKINVKGVIVRLSKIEDTHYISLADLAKQRSKGTKNTKGFSQKKDKKLL